VPVTDLNMYYKPWKAKIPWLSCCDSYSGSTWHT